MDLLRERSAALRAQWQELMRIDEAILRKLQFMEEKQEHIFWDGYVGYPSLSGGTSPLAAREILYMKDSFYFYPTIAFYEENLKYFGAYVVGPDMGGEEEELPEESQATLPIPKGDYLVAFHKGSYDEIPSILPRCVGRMPI